MRSRRGNGTGFAARLRALREATGMTRGALAKAAGLNAFGVAKLEQSVREPGWATVLALADALGARTDDFRPEAPKKRSR